MLTGADAPSSIRRGNIDGSPSFVLATALARSQSLIEQSDVDNTEMAEPANIVSPADIDIRALNLTAHALSPIGALLPFIHGRRRQSPKSIFCLPSTRCIRP